MKTRRSTIVLAVILILSTLALLLPACTPLPAVVDGYTAVIPSALRAGTTQLVPVSLFNGYARAAGQVTLALYKDGSSISSATSHIAGSGSVRLDVPNVPEGDYTVQINGPGFQDQAKVAIANSYLVFLQTDKPIYKPGQIIHMRVLTLDPDLMPLSDSVTVETLDAKGTKVFRSTVSTDAYGMATLDLPLSTEPNLGTWKLNATTAKNKTELDVRVEEYVLPKYEVAPDLPRDWFLVNEPIKGKVSATYSFGKPVLGDLTITATRYVGQWQAYATVTMPIDGSADFTIPAVGYVAGVPAAGGQGNVQLDFTVTEKSTGYVQKTTRLLTVAQSSLVLQAIPSASIFKPGLPFNFLLISQTPDNLPVDASVAVKATYFRKDFTQTSAEQKTVATVKGKALFTITPPADAVAMTLTATANGTTTTKSLESGYSPTGNFIHLEQTTTGTVNVGQPVSFKVFSTNEATTFYYEVVSRGQVVFSDYATGANINFETTPAMAPTAKLLVYQVLPNSEIAADCLPFKVSASYPQAMSVHFSTGQAKPGDKVGIDIATQGQARVGLAAVDKSVYILAENRLNLQQVFDDLDKLYMQPQAELHEVIPIQSITSRGASDTFKDAGVVVLSNKNMPAGQTYQNQIKNERGGFGGIFPPMAQDAKGPAGPQLTTTATATAASNAGLADVQRVRQFFPETWLWQDVTTDASGKATLSVTVPDSITTWMLQAVAISKTKGLGIDEAQLQAFQPFFLSADLPYSAIRGEQFPLKVAIYNYLDKPQTVQVQLEKAGWFDLTGSDTQSVTIGPNDIGGAQFTIRPAKLGTNDVKITARSAQAADAVIKTLIVEPEGIARELVDNLTLSPGDAKTLDASLPDGIVDGSGRVYLALTSSYLTQTVNGLDALLQMPFGCGEQNMIVFAPDVFITRYLRDSGQLKPEIMAKAQMLMLTGYQRELTYRHSDGSFSAFGNQDKEGSLWLTAFVLKSFSQAKDLIYIDDGMLNAAKTWIVSHQNADGSFDQVGLVIHQEMMGGVKGKTALTAYVAAALMDSGEKTASAKAAAYLEGKIGEVSYPYAMALVTYALESAGSKKAGDAYMKLMTMAKEDENGLHWGDDILPAADPAPQPKGPAFMPFMRPPVNKPANIEATGYALMALLKQGDNMNAGRAAKWLVSKRNAYGGFGSTQDTVVGLEALTRYATGTRSDVDLTVTVDNGSGPARQFRITQANFDVLQSIDVPPDAQVKVTVAGKGQAVGQLVRRFSVPEAPLQTQTDALSIKVDYDTTKVAVNDLVKVSVEVGFNPPEPMEAGMTVVDISVPTGFGAVADSVAAAMKQDVRIKRYDISGRKVIFYLEDLMPGDTVHFNFNVQVQYPVSAKAVPSTAYSYYNPQISAETLGKDMTVTAR